MFYQNDTTFTIFNRTVQILTRPYAKNFRKTLNQFNPSVFVISLWNYAPVRFSAFKYTNLNKYYIKMTRLA